MTRHLLFVLLLTTALALAEDKPKTQHARGAAKAQKKEAQKKTEAAQPGVQPTQEKTQPAQAEKEAAPGPSEEEKGQPAEDTKLTSVPEAKALGMSILGNQDAPKSLVIVPWKSSELGNSPGISAMLDDSRQPVDKEVFMRALRYYDIRSGTKP
jgi:hypothetical protein